MLCIYLEAATKKYMIRGLKANLLTLPEKTVCTHFFHFSKAEVEKIEGLYQQLSMLYKQSLGKKLINVLCNV